jgi:hypothetical protein
VAAGNLLTRGATISIPKMALFDGKFTFIFGAIINYSLAFQIRVSFTVKHNSAAHRFVHYSIIELVSSRIL